MRGEYCRHAFHVAFHGVTTARVREDEEIRARGDDEDADRDVGDVEGWLEPAVQVAEVGARVVDVVSVMAFCLSCRVVGDGG